VGGLAASWGKDDPTLVCRMLERLEHRGPDLRETFEAGTSCLGFAGAEDETSGDARSVAGAAAVIDGRAYNLDELCGRGKADEGPSRDLLELYRQEGPGFVEELNGEFTLAIVDGSRFMVARDPLGIKPLYLARRGEELLFASEIKAFPRDVDSIEVFEAGTYFDSEEGFVDYFDLPERKRLKEATDPKRAAARVRHLFNAAVRRRLAEGPVGVFLSGGLDSSVVAAVVTMIAKEAGSQILSFAVGTEGSSDLRHAEAVSRYLGTQHHTHVIREEEVERLLPDVIYHLESFDAPLVRSSIANFVVSREAHRHGLRHVFCGEGSDELFCGYQYLKKFEPSELGEEMEKLFSGLPQNGMQRVDRMTNAHSLEGFAPFLDMDLVEFSWSIPVDYKIHGDEKVEKWVLRRAFEDDLPEAVVWRKKKKFFEGAGLEDTVRKIADNAITDETFERERRVDDDLALSTKEEFYCYRIFSRLFPYRSILDTIGWTRTMS